MRRRSREVLCQSLAEAEDATDVAAIDTEVELVVGVVQGYSFASDFLANAEKGRLRAVGAVDLFDAAAEDGVSVDFVAEFWWEFEEGGGGRCCGRHCGDGGVVLVVELRRVTTIVAFVVFSKA